MRSIGLKPDWCEGYITLARAQREMGEVHLAIDSYKKAISLLDTAESLSEEEKKALISSLDLKNNDLVLVIADKSSVYRKKQGNWKRFSPLLLPLLFMPRTIIRSMASCREGHTLWPI